ncbi:nucleoside/nucleotide kinase family protein [Pseudobutyrivibrio xylanivorans]|uniref:Nucleoside/nucleotide kinase family protein n=1 Tax=Pseudobutyrivibrio xylanivorans TaxID=185007 RepID=A0A5P6VM77_PSEXY|nr:nucleoside/nucleotide kinase family protein [Pseudobutyrivibrio xylanivorans]QFJ53512.1 nucleoside/nucleotide kinase family protein [Pseudobutyrivibrio xylanivorans]
MVDYKININGLDVDAHYSEENINEIFLPLLERLTKLQKDKNRRILVMLAAPPGAGKSTLVSFLEKLAKETEGITELQAVGMDGFHRRQEYLTSHTTVRDGQEMLMVKIKGAPITFDLPLLKERIEKVAAGHNCGWPIYDRTLHNPVDNVITVSAPIVLLEGNYLLLDETGWDELASFADYTIRITAEEEHLKKRLIERKAASGNSIEDATAFVDFSDMANVHTCLTKSKKADLTLEVLEDDTLRIEA